MRIVLYLHLVSDFAGTHCALSLLRGQRQRGVFCSRCGSYIGSVADHRRETIKWYLACVALYVVLIAYL